MAVTREHVDRRILLRRHALPVGLWMRLEVSAMSGDGLAGDRMVVEVRADGKDTSVLLYWAIICGWWSLLGLLLFVAVTVLEAGIRTHYRGE